VIACRPVGVLETEDDAGGDEKILCVPLRRISSQYDAVHEVGDVRPYLVKQIEHFFTHYKDLEEGKWMKLKGWGDSALAKKYINESVERFARNPAAPNF
jgi:inorganic pyrophosphatase